MNRLSSAVELLFIELNSISKSILFNEAFMDRVIALLELHAKLELQ